MKPKSPRKLERHFKGVANHRRIQILLMIAKNPEIIQEDIIEELKSNQKTISEHIRRLHLAGLIDKSYAGRSVQHTLTPYGTIFVNFIREFSKHGSND
ncbi:ArsR family transcriptional regulator [Candidatus Kaiserbacteria bacterium]|nr:ArsR family transcriptional regulator [Candidatus Kaiserbacteria bacterium]